MSTPYQTDDAAGPACASGSAGTAGPITTPGPAIDPRTGAEITATHPHGGDDAAQPTMPSDVSLHDASPRLTPFWRSLVIVLTVVGVLLTMNQVFFWNVGGVTIPTNSFLYLLIAVFVPIVFIVTPIRKHGAAARQRRGVPWYDVLLLLAVVGTSAYFAVHGIEIQEYGWQYMAPTLATVLSFVFWALILETLRRAAGLVVLVIAFLFSVYPLFAGIIPLSFLQGISYDLPTLAQVHTMGVDSVLGLPLQTAGTILVGFLLFGVVLQHTGGADFFHELSMAVFGRYRGGSAKVAVASSAAMGMMSGSAVSNVLTTGPMTIPAMKRSGFSARVAGAVEATASSGGSITPPIMGTAAFLMVSFVGVPYTSILVAATIPAILYYLGIFLQIDGYAAQRGLRGTPKNLLPRARHALAMGWPYLGALAVLTALLFTTDSEARVPYWVVAILLLIALVKPSVTFGPRQWVDMGVDVGKTLAQIVGIIAGVGLILGGLTATGVALSLSRDLVALVGDNVVLILIAGAVVCFILGMGLTISAAYVFLAIVMVPAVTALGVDPIAAHLFVIYWASVSYITPPVGLAAFAAAGISKASPMATCFSAMKLGAVKYVVPFGFALNPALVAQGEPVHIGLAFLSSLVAVYAIAAAMGGWLTFVERQLPLYLRVVLAVGGFMMFLPGAPVTLIGLALVVAAAVLARLRQPRAVVDPETGQITRVPEGAEVPDAARGTHGAHGTGGAPAGAHAPHENTKENAS
ncbi:TRAP transporter permease [Kocuria marina]|uniref:TRAP transporter, 4TM/12TM fusion protein n=1 Tax=Kocuria marina subsp. indica TaxID=1049583 RepID=A0A1X7CD93_9MICC|nr:TRAP transporter permease [Kocuria indica]OXS85512.1 C4-dicarboxylate ABC transporter [Kocuria indica]RLP58959.1 TRAP transporter permease [Kocuria indica]SME94504.1 TRAP transporter, 4TM/12TM fusion protein [Kocuria indica]